MGLVGEHKMSKPFSRQSPDQMETMLQRYRNLYQSIQQRGGDQTLSSILSLDRAKAQSLNPMDQAEYLAVIDLMETEFLGSSKKRKRRSEELQVTKPEPLE